MKILYMNLLNYNSGQRRMDENIIHELVKIADVYVVCPKGWYEHQVESATYIFYEPKTSIKNDGVADYIKDIKNVLYANMVRKQQQVDICLFASYNTVVFPIWTIVARLSLSKCFIIQNNNIDGIRTSRVKNTLFNIYSRKVNHIVLEKFIEEYLIKELSIPQDHVYVLPHPLNSNKVYSKKIYDCVGISNSNDDDWINEIISIEKRSHELEKNKCRVILRSKKHCYDNGWLTVFSGWLNDKDYNEYINQAKTVFLPFPPSFQYRMSGSVVDAFSNHTSVIGSAIPLFIYYSKKYGNICYIANSPNDFMERVISSARDVHDNNEFQEFIDDHSNQIVLDSLKKMITTDG